MSSLTKLPGELFDLILDFFEDVNEVRTLAGLCLVNRKWNEWTTPRLYARWNFDDSIHPFCSLWMYLRTVLERTDLAARVIALDVRYPSYDFDLYRGRVQCTTKDLVNVPISIMRAGIQMRDWNVLQCAMGEQADGVMALLVTLLPNLRSLQLLYDDPRKFLHKVLQYSLAPEAAKPQNCALQNLQELRIMHALDKDYYPDDVANRVNPGRLKAKHNWQFLLLPQLREAALFDFDMFEDPYEQNLLRMTPENTSSVTHLTLVQYFDTAVYNRSFHAVPSLPRVLVSLTLFMTDIYEMGNGNDQIINQVNDPLWHILRKHCDTLEHFDFCRGMRGHHVARARQGEVNIAPLSGGMFPKLKHVCVNIETMLGGHNGRRLAKYHQLKDKLPIHLEYFCLYKPSGMVEISDVGEHIRELVDRPGSQLKTIVVENELPCRQPYRAEASRRIGSLAGVKEYCERKGVVFHYLLTKEVRIFNEIMKPKSEVSRASRLPELEKLLVEHNARRECWEDRHRR